MISSRLTWTKALQTLASQATKALALFRRFDYYVNGVNPKTALIVFDRAIAPVLLYGSEIWGHTVAKPIEKVQITFCKFILASCIPVKSTDFGGSLPIFLPFLPSYRQPTDLPQSTDFYRFFRGSTEF